MASALPIATDCCFPQANCNVTVVITDGSGGGGTSVVGWFSVKSLAEAKAIPTLSTNKHLSINGSEQGGDGLLGAFDWDALSVLVDDFGGSVIQPQDVPAIGRWIRRT